MKFKAYGTAAVAACALAVAPAVFPAQSNEARKLNELRNTVVNLLQGLVERGVLTREQAEAMVRDAQAKAEADAAALAAQEQAEAGAVRVPYVPQIVKEEIKRQVTSELTDSLSREVMEQARSEDSLRAALPEWARRVRLSGDVRVRGQGDLYAQDNARNAYLDFLAVNDRGGVGRAGAAAVLNTSEDRERLRARLRLGVDAELGYGWSLGLRLATGNLRDPVSTNQTLGNTGARYQTGVDLAYVRWAGVSRTGRQAFNFWGGRIPNPWLSTDLVWDSDLTFEGLAAQYRFGLSRSDPAGRNVYATLGAFPLQEVELSSDDKWLYGGQLGFDWKLDGGSRFRLGAAYYHYENITGRRNALDSNLLDFTAPQFVQRGNTLFDIRNDADPSTNLFALATSYELASATAQLEWRPTPAHRLLLTADYVRNVGYDEDEVLSNTGLALEARDEGYQAELGFGSISLAQSRAWRAFVGYRYLQGDAVLDAFTDSDFRLGGTDVKGYFVGLDYAVTPKVLARLRYLSGNEIDGPPLGIDVLQLDLNAQF
jgi:hypothetical protein